MKHYGKLLLWGLVPIPFGYLANHLVARGITLYPLIELACLRQQLESVARHYVTDMLRGCARLFIDEAIDGGDDNLRSTVPSFFLLISHEDQRGP